MLNRTPSPSLTDAPAAADDAIDMRLTAIIYGGDGTNLFEFRTLDGSDVPPFSAGAHVDVNLPNGTIRQYSIASSQADRTRYLLGVKLEENGRGGSRFLHEQVRVGSVLKIGLPRNNFPLNENAASSVFIAGGIGVTPILCMIDRLKTLGRDFRLHYAVRVRDEALLAQIDEADDRISPACRRRTGRTAAGHRGDRRCRCARRRTLLLWPGADAGCIRGRVRQPPASSACIWSVSARRTMLRPPAAPTPSSSRNRSAASPCSQARRCCRRCRMRD